MSGNIIGQTLLNRYRVDAFIASGGMGTVYRVWDMKRNVPLAMKVLHADLADDPSALKIFQREARALKKLTHPNIVPFYGLNQTQDFFFFLERFIDGPTLKDILRNQRTTPLPLEEALVYFTAICAALGFAHHNGVVHCDIKPGNIMVDRGGNIYLTDFGIARHAESAVTTFAGSGTPAYMAPEQIQEEVVSPATDVYALGIMLFEMLTGIRPFRGSEASLEKKGETSGERIRYAQLNVNPPDPRQHNPSIPAELAQVISTAMSKSSVERYQNATEMLEAVLAVTGTTSTKMANRVDFSNYPQFFPSSVTQDVPEKLITASGQPHPKLSSRVITIIGSFVLLASIIAFAFSQARNSPSLPSDAPMDYIVPSFTRMQINNTPIPPTNTALPKIPKNTGSNWIAYTYGTDQDSSGTAPRYLEMLNIQTGEKRQLTFDDGGVNFPSFSPNGDQIVYSGCKNKECRLYIIDLRSGTTEKITRITIMAMWPSWCPDATKNLIAFEGRNDINRKIYVLDRSTGETTAVTRGSFDIRPSWSPDCSKIVYLRDIHGQNDIYIHDLEKKREYAIAETPLDEFNASWFPDGSQILFTRVSSDTNNDGVLNLNDRSDLLIINPDGSGEVGLSYGQYSIFSPSFSSDGKQIVFVSFQGNPQNQEIYIYSFADASFRSITEVGPYNHTDWSP